MYKSADAKGVACVQIFAIMPRFHCVSLEDFLWNVALFLDTLGILPVKIYPQSFTSFLILELSHEADLF
jgi:hypothetical protein